MAFNIGDRVRVKDYEEIADHLKAKNTGDDPSMWNAGKAKCCGQRAKSLTSCTAPPTRSTSTAFISMNSLKEAEQTSPKKHLSF